jgi:hypothetical protein
LTEDEVRGDPRAAAMAPPETTVPLDEASQSLLASGAERDGPRVVPAEVNVPKPLAPVPVLTRSRAGAARLPLLDRLFAEWTRSGLADRYPDEPVRPPGAAYLANFAR